MQTESVPETKTVQLPDKCNMEALPRLLGFAEYTPTVKQAQAVYLFLTQETNTPIHRIVGEITYDASLWYKWKKTPGFMEWFEEVAQATFSREKLLDVHAAIYRRALGNSPADSKLFLQRFDPEYAERQTLDTRHTFQGYNPAGASRSEERQRKALVNSVESPPVLQGNAREAGAQPLLQADTGDCGSADASPQDGDTESIEGVDHVYAGLARALQAQSHDAAREPEPGTPASNEESVVIEAETQQDPGGGDSEDRDS